MEIQNLRAVVFRRGATWVAQFLERDIAVQARSLDDLSYEIQRTLVAYLVAAKATGSAAFGHLPRAPAFYWRLYEESPAPLLVKIEEFRTPDTRSVELPQLDVHAFVGTLEGGWGGASPVAGHAS